LLDDGLADRRGDLVYADLAKGVPIGSAQKRQDVVVQRCAHGGWKPGTDKCDLPSLSEEVLKRRSEVP